MRQFIYFDPLNREIIFYEDEIQQVFNWSNSSLTRLGIFISCTNISVSTLRRTIDIELESLNSLRIKVVEDVRLRIGVSGAWDGSYRKAGTPENRAEVISRHAPYIDAVYNSPMGRITFYPDGNFRIISSTASRQGRYAFFHLDNFLMLELRDTETRTSEIRVETGLRETYLIESLVNDAPEPGQNSANDPAGNNPYRIMVLSRVLLGARGIQRMHEGNITLNLAN